MLFNSYIFILLFLPVTLIGYFLLNRIGKAWPAQMFVIGMSLWFYGYYDPWYLFVIGASVLVNYSISKTISKVADDNAAVKKKMLLITGIVLNLASIFYFKYCKFFVENINAVFKTDLVVKNIVLPLGISFFTFQQISFLVDSYRGETKDYGFIEYTLFVVYFPQLIAGPIVLHSEMLPQFRDEKRRRADYANLFHGLFIFSLGLAKKVLIADTFSKAVAMGFGDVEALGWIEALLVSFGYTFQLYFDFSGYCDMAIGIACMMNLDLPQNFDSPYRSTSITDFWGRWHITLTRFLRQYVYFPLGGSKKGRGRTYVNILIVFLVSGIWHGANWTFIVWGLLHGILNCINRMTDSLWNRLPKVIRWFVNFIVVDLLWVIFRAESLDQAICFFKRMLAFGPAAVNSKLADAFCFSEIRIFAKDLLGMSEKSYAFGGMAFTLIVSFCIVLLAKNSSRIEKKPTVIRSLSTALLLVWSVISLSGVTEFLYFGF